MKRFEVFASAICILSTLQPEKSYSENEFVGYGKLPQEMFSDYKKKTFKTKLPLKKSGIHSENLKNKLLAGRVKRNKARSDSAANSTLVYKVNIPTESGEIQTNCIENESFLDKDTKLIAYDKNNKSKKITLETLGLSFYSCSTEEKNDEDFARLTLQKGKLIGGLLKKDNLYNLSPIGKSANFNVKKVEDTDIEGVKTCDSDSEESPETSASKVVSLRALDIIASKDTGYRRELEMALEADAEFTSKAGGTAKVIPYMLKAANEADGIYNAQMGISIRATWASYWEYPQTDPYSSVFNQKDGTTQGSSADNVLAEFGQKFRPKTRYDIKQFFTGKDIYRAANGNDNQRNMSVAGISPIGGICNSAYGTKPFEMNSVVVEYLPNLQANLTGHEIAHNLGSYHDKCSPEDRSLMCPTVYKSSTNFSENSRNSVANTLSTDFSYCMDTMYVPVADNFEPKKGAAGKAVTITGSNFMGDGYKQDAVKSVFVGNKKADFTINSANEINISLPAGLAAGENTILLQNSRNKALANTKFNVITKPSAPGALTIKDNGDGSYSLSWKPGSQAEGYSVYISDGGASGFKEISKLSADAASFIIKDLGPDKKYSFKVLTSNEAGVSDFSNQVSVKTKANSTPTPNPTIPVNTPVPTSVATIVGTSTATPAATIRPGATATPASGTATPRPTTAPPVSTPVPTSSYENIAKINLIGVVRDLQTNAGLRGVTVTVTLGSQVTRSTTANDGLFSFSGTAQDKNNLNLTLKLTKQGYQTFERKFTKVSDLPTQPATIYRLVNLNPTFR